MANKRTTKKAPAEVGAVEEAEDQSQSREALLEWGMDALSLEWLNLKPTDGDTIHGNEKWEIVSRGAKATVSAYGQAAREIRHSIPDDEIASNYFAMKHLHLVARDGFLALFWLVQELMEDQAGLPGEARKALAKSAAIAKLLNDPRQAEMSEINAEWVRWSKGEVIYKNDSDFARKMMEKAVHIKNEGSIKNAISRWRKESSS